MLRNLIKWARITKPAPAEAQQFAVQQVSYSGKVGDAAVVMPYGLHANLPVDSLALMFSVNDESGNRAIIGYDAKNRPTLEEGEVAFYHPPTDSFIIFRASGDLDIQAGTEGGGNVNITAATVNITADDVDISGNLTVGGDTALTAVVTSGGTDIGSTHTHSGSLTAPAGPVVPTGAPVPPLPP